jgi:transposase
MVAAIGTANVLQRPRLRRLARTGDAHADLDGRPHHPGQDIQARQSLRVLFVEVARDVLIRPNGWERCGLKPWIEAAKNRLHPNVLAIALANKLARIAWTVLNKESNFECIRTNKMSPRTA